MLKSVGMLMMAVMLAAAVFSGCGAGAEGTAAGVSETGFEPPEEIITENEQGEPQTWSYQYSTKIPADMGKTNIGGAALENVTYYYTDQNGYEIGVDTAGRVVSYYDAEGEITARWQATSNTEESMFVVLEQAAEHIANVDLNHFQQITFLTGNSSNEFYCYEDPDSPYMDTLTAYFTPNGGLHAMFFYYSGLDAVSDSDVDYFSEQITAYLQQNGVTAEHTIHTTYQLVEDTLIARFTVTYNDPEQGAWVENYVAGKPFK